MLLYVTGLVLITGAVELGIAYFLSTRGAVPAVLSTLALVSFAVVVALVAAGGVLIYRGLRALRSRSESASETSSAD